MTKKHFDRLAYGLSRCEPDGLECIRSRHVWELCVQAVSEVCSFASERFNPVRFENACRYEYWVDRRPPK